MRGPSGHGPSVVGVSITDAPPPLKVLVPDDLGLDFSTATSAITVAPYTPGSPWPSDGLDSTVVVVGYENAAAVGARFGDLPRLQLVQTLNAGYEQWLPHLPDGVMLSNGRGAHGGSSAEWAVAALLAIYRDLGSFKDAQSLGVCDPGTPRR